MDVLGHLKKWARPITPAFLSRNPHFNFISLHYFWIVGWTLLGSILLYGAGRGKLAYIDALCFAAGANTQAGLNPLDVNLLNTFQQVVIYILTLLSNPMTINSSVVFLRLHWFEKRFQHIVQDARLRRSTIGNTRSKGKTDVPDVERGMINPRDINVVHNTGQPARIANDGMLLNQYPPERASPANSSASKDGSDEQDSGKHLQLDPPHIKFSDNLSRMNVVEDIPMPRPRTNAEHIAILEKQRKADKSVLRIPGPRDAEMGALPEEFEDVEEDPDTTLRRRESSPERQVESQRLPFAERHPTISIAEPQKPPRGDPNQPRGMEDNAEASSSAPGGLRFRGRAAQRFSWSETSNTLPGPLRRIRTALSQNQGDNSMPYLSWQPTMGRNSQFVDLTEEQREELGGIEYRSLKTLAVILVVYFVGYSIFGIITLVPWILHNNPVYGSIVDANGVDRVWWGLFTSNSAFMDLGFTLTPDSMNSFNTAIFPLLIMSLLIILGNTGFPVALRFMIWLTSLVVPHGSGLWEELRFLLDHPRRCFTLLFPANANWWLFTTLVAFNGIDLILFLVLDLTSDAVSMLPWNIRVLDGWFQATSTRTAGFTCVNLADLHPAVQVSYLIMMYISIFPVAISIRKTNVYEEKSLGLYTTHEDDPDDTTQPGISYVGMHLRRQLSFDLWFVFLGFFILNITEGPRIMTGDISMFAVLFEVVSAYGTVGMSLGYTGTNASLLAQFSVLGKLVISGMMIRGRHRGLPYGLDRAILLPSENLHRKETEDADLRSRRQAAISIPYRQQPRGISEDRSNLFTRLLHVGPSYSMPRTETMPERASVSVEPSASATARVSRDPVPGEPARRRTEPSNFLAS